jgi:uncharacterized protein YhfF
VSDPTAIAAFVAEARAALPGERLDRWTVRTFGNSATIANQVVPLIVSGEKTGTFALEAEFASSGTPRPQVGDWYVVTTFEGHPVALYRVTETEVLPFDAIAERHVAVEGPRLRDVAAWRRVHWDYWTSTLGAMGKTPTEDMLVVFQRFEVRHVAASQRK